MRLRPVQRPVQRGAIHGLFGRETFPDGAILHFDANADPYTEQTGGVHTFNHAVLSPQYQRNADGSYTDIGAKPAVDVFDGEKWLRSCGAVTNLFGGDTSQARSVSLTNGTVYTLHVFGAGTVSCSYGTATVEAPLKITATATASVTFTPSGATYWMLTATAYPVPYVPPGVTQPASNATNTNGSWFTLPDGSELWKALDGQADGVELVTNGGFESGVMSTSPAITFTSLELTQTQEYVKVGLYAGKLTDTVLAPAIHNMRPLGHFGIGASVGIVVTGSVYIPSSLNTNGFRIYDISDGSVITTITNVRDTWVDFRFTRQAKGVAWSLGLGNNNSENWAGGSIYLDNISIQRIQPQPLTLATRVRMGVGSGDLPAAITAINVLSSRDFIVDVQHFRVETATPTFSGARAYDGSSVAIIPITGWARNAIIRRVTQVNTAGTQFRVGYMIEGTHTTIQWSSWAAFDGSFNPSTLYRLMLGYGNAYPMWFNKITAWRKQVSDAEIREAMA